MARDASVAVERIDEGLVVGAFGDVDAHRLFDGECLLANDEQSSANEEQNGGDDDDREKMLFLHDYSRISWYRCVSMNRSERMTQSRRVAQWT